MDIASCPVKTTADVISGKWKPLILFFLKQGRRRYSDLRREIPAPSHKVITEQLRQLEREGIVSPRVFAQVPPKVEYSLSAYGKTLIPLLSQMASWGTKHAAKLTVRPPQRCH